MLEMNKHNKNIINLHYDITLACNNRCSYCYAFNDLDNNKLFNGEIFEQTIKAVNNIDKNEYIVELDFLGGEPLLVYEKVFEFIERVPNVFFTITSNINFDPESKRIKDLIEFLNNKNVLLMASWHDSSNQHFFKTNILKLKKYVVVTLILDDNNLDKVYEYSLFLRQHNIKYDIEFIYDNSNSKMTNIDNKFYIDIIKHSRNNNILITKFDDKLYTYAEAIESDLLNISFNYHTICNLTQLKINYNGIIGLICNNPFKLGHIKDGIHIKNLYCKDYNCRCSLKNYKKLTKK